MVNSFLKNRYIMEKVWNFGAKASAGEKEKEGISSTNFWQPHCSKSARRRSELWLIKVSRRSYAFDSEVHLAECDDQLFLEEIRWLAWKLRGAIILRLLKPPLSTGRIRLGRNVSTCSRARTALHCSSKFAIASFCRVRYLLHLHGGYRDPMDHSIIHGDFLSWVYLSTPPPPPPTTYG